MFKYLLIALLSMALLSSCTIHHYHGAQAPRRWIHYYRHEQRQNERQRRRLVKTNITWSKL